MSHKCVGSFGSPPAFVGTNYVCETTIHNKTSSGLFSLDPLFAGRHFCAELPEPTTEPLQIRICSDQSLADEDVLLQFAELYVQ